jgi:hypothetical protein
MTAMAVAVADLDGDGDKDILYGTRETVEGGWIPNQGGGVFGSPITLFSPLDRPVWVSSRDIDNDGDRDGSGSHIELMAHPASRTGVRHVGRSRSMAGCQREDFASDRRLRTA